MAKPALKSELAKRRTSLGLSQAELAERLGVNQATVSRAENSDEPDRRFVLALTALELMPTDQAGAA